MPRLEQFKLPDLGEGLTEGEILKWLVQPGDEVKLNQPIVEVETAKAAVELPSPYAGVVAELLHGEGETVDVGSPIITFDTQPGAEPVAVGEPVDPTVDPAAVNPAESVAAAVEPETEVGTPPAEGAVEPGFIGGPAPGGRTSVLVGYGPRSVLAKRRPRKAPAAGAESSSASPATADVAVLAKPPVRKLAKDLGVDLRTVTASGPAGTITRSDVESASAGLPAAGAAGVPMAGPQGGVPAPAGFDPVTRERRLPIKGVRKHTAAAMVSSAFTAPHVTEFVAVDVTRTMRAVARLKSAAGFQDVRVSPLLLVAKALLLAVRRHPMINSTWDERAQEIVVKGYVNLGVAAATPRGLIVPNIKDADRLSLRELADALAGLVATAREGRTTPADMQGGTITITNVGVFGVDSGTPILNPGEAAILAFGAVRETPWVHKGKVRPRMVTTLGLSFDHRIVDGELGSRFLADVAAVLRDPGTTALAWS